MSTIAEELPDASDIGLRLLSLRNDAPQWMVYNGEKDGQPVMAWRFWPKFLRDREGGPDAWRQIIHWIEANKPADPSCGLWPVEQDFSRKSSSVWLIYSPVPLADKSALSDISRLPQLVDEIVGTLGLLHQRGMLHLDVHQANLFDAQGQFRLAGFGLDLRQVSAATIGSNEGLARSKYGAPELWDASGRSELGAWTDIFGAAATLTYCLLGKPPPDFRTRIKDPSWRSKLSSDIAGATDKLGAISPKIASMIVHGLEPRIADRPDSVVSWSSTYVASTLPVVLATEPVEDIVPPQADTGQSARPSQDDFVGDEEGEEEETRGAPLLLAACLVGAVVLGGYLYSSQADDAQLAVAESTSEMVAADVAVDLASQAAIAAVEDAVAGVEDAPWDASDPDLQQLEDDAMEGADGMALADDINRMDSRETASEPAPPASNSSIPRTIDRVPTPRSSPTSGSNTLPPPPPRSRSVVLPGSQSPQIVSGPSHVSGSINQVNDFPTSERGRLARKGTSVEVRFSVGVNGRASNCRVVRPGPDAATNARLCSLVISKLRFNPARDANGSAVVSTYGWRQSFQ